MAQQSGIAAGAQAGAAFGPWGAAIGGAMGAVSDIAGAGGPMTSGSGLWDMRNSFDGSGWTVSTGGSKATGGARTGGIGDQGTQPQGAVGQSMGMAQQAGIGYIGALLLAGVAVYLLAK